MFEMLLFMFLIVPLPHNIRRNILTYEHSENAQFLEMGTNIVQLRLRE